jgi:hypothetical protein
MAAKTGKSGQTVFLYNGSGVRPTIKTGGRVMAATKRKGGHSTARGRKAGGGATSVRRKRRPQPRAYSLNANPANPGKRKSSRGRGRSRSRHVRRNPGIFAGAQNLVGQLFFGGLGAFAASTASLLNPIAAASALVATIMDVGIALGVSWLGGKVFPKHRETIRVGAFAFVAGNIVTRYAPNLQQSIVSLSPINRGQLTAGNSGGVIDDTISDVYEVPAGGFGDVVEVGSAGGQDYM